MTLARRMAVLRAIEGKKRPYPILPCKDLLCDNRCSIRSVISRERPRRPWLWLCSVDMSDYGRPAFGNPLSAMSFRYGRARPMSRATVPVIWSRVSDSRQLCLPANSET